MNAPVRAPVRPATGGSASAVRVLLRSAALAVFWLLTLLTLLLK